MGAVNKLFFEYFHIPKCGKICEKVILARMAVSTVIVLACLAGMGITAYAWFSSSVTAASSVLTAADYDIAVSVAVTQQNVSVEPDAAGTYILPVGVYEVNLEKMGTATTGFCILEAEAGQRKAIYHTQQIGVDGMAERLGLKFTLELTETVKVKFTAHWGTSSYYGYTNTQVERYIQNGEKVILAIDEMQIAPPITQQTPIPSEPTEATKGEDGYIIHIVEVGDNLYDLANTYGTTMDAIAALNGIDNKRLIVIGQQLKIPTSNEQDAQG